MSEAGHCRLHRSLLGHPAFRNDAEAMAFAWMVMRASWKATRVRYKGHGISLERGDLAVSVRDFSAAMDRPKGWVERLFARLQSETMIRTRVETGVTVITICNYDKYQLSVTPDRTVTGTANETQTGQRRDTEQGREGIKEVSSGSKEPSLVHPKPDDRFAEFWSLYPRKIAKTPAHKAYLKALKETDHATLIAGLTAQIGWGIFAEPKYSPHAATWLGAGRWADERDGRGKGVAGGANTGAGRSRVRDIAELVAERHAAEDARMEVPGRQASVFPDDSDWGCGAIEGEYRAGYPAG